MQIGSSTEEQIDFIVMEILPGISISMNHNNHQLQQSSISR